MGSSINPWAFDQVNKNYETKKSNGNWASKLQVETGSKLKIHYSQVECTGDETEFGACRMLGKIFMSTKGPTVSQCSLNSGFWNFDNLFQNPNANALMTEMWLCSAKSDVQLIHKLKCQTVLFQIHHLLRTVFILFRLFFRLWIITYDLPDAIPVFWHAIPT